MERLAHFNVSGKVSPNPRKKNTLVEERSIKIYEFICFFYDSLLAKIDYYFTTMLYLALINTTIMTEKFHYHFTLSHMGSTGSFLNNTYSSICKCGFNWR